MEEALLAFLNGYAPLKAFANAIAWRQLPRAETLPAVSLWVTTPGYNYSYKAVDRLRLPLVQADCWGSTDAECAELTALFDAALHRRDDPQILVFIKGGSDDATKGDAPRADGAADFFRARRDCRVRFKPA